MLIRKCLTPDQQENMPDSTDLYDYIDERTGEVTRVDPILHIIRSQNAQDPDFITNRTPVAEAVFRMFLISSNQPMTPFELSQRISRKPSEILAQLGGRMVYNGIRPVAE